MKSNMVESLQLLFHCGVFEPDDLIKNTLGAAIGNAIRKDSVEEKRRMLTNDQNCVLSLLRESMGAPSVYCEPDSAGALCGIILHNGILLTVFPTVRKKAEAGIGLMQEAEAELRPHFYAALKQSLLQEHEGIMVLGGLRDAGFDCIPLKGWEMRNLYPDKAMRQMADLDILVQPYEHKRIKAVMEKLGFTGDAESSWKHDCFKKGEVTVETHKRLTDDSGVIQQWERDVWNRANRRDGIVQAMSDEDYYIFHFVHLHKDFMNGSLGLRRITDTWLLQKLPVDSEAVLQTLTKMGLQRFHEKMVALSRAAMGDTSLDEGAEIMLTHACKYGIYGSEKSYKSGRIAAMGNSVRSGKIKSLTAAVFLPYKRMKAQFPILRKWPVLLPFCWCKRIFKLMRGNVRRKRIMMDYRNISEEDYNEMKRFFEAGGVL